MTGATADRFKIPLRGYIKEGYKADISIINVDEMKVDESKPDTTPTGINYVLINGKLVLENDKYCGGRNGEVVLKPVE